MFPSRSSSSSVIYAFIIVFIGFSIAGTDAGKLSRIVGGNDAKPGEIPWQVSIRGYDSHLCGGTIIGKRHILTAAHCIVGVTEAPYSEMTVVTGSHTLEPATGKTYRVKDVKIHEEYRQRTKLTSIKNDIAVISLRKEIESNEFQRSIALPTGDVPNGVQGIVSGFGRTSYPHGKLSQILQKFYVTVLSNDECFAKGVRIQSNKICAFKNVGYGTCKGDSGGPLVYKNQIVGIISTSIPCGTGFPDTYTRVYHYLEFINKAMATI